MTNRTAHELRSACLTAELVPAGAGYARSRFDWSGCVRQVTGTDGRKYLGADARPAPDGCGGEGLMEEFFASDQGTYEDARPGEGFLKLGVGVLQKTGDAPYSQKENYPILVLVEREESFGADTARMAEKQACYKGFAYRLERTVSVRGSALRISARLINTGSRALNFSVYNHNFLPAGPGLVLCGSFSAPEAAGLLRSRKDGCADVRIPDTPRGAALTGCRNASGAWTCLCGSGRAVRAEVFAPVSRGYVWATKDTVCPELFSDFTVLPGAACRWERAYHFISGTCEHGCPGCAQKGK